MSRAMFGTPIACALIAAAGAFASAAGAQEYPARPITIVVPFPAGAAVDNIVRPLTGELQRLLGQPVVVDNKGGAQGVIGTQLVARAKPDGYTLLAGSSTTLAANVGLFKSLPYDPIKDFQPVAGLGYTSMMFLVRADSQVRDLKGLAAYARSQPAPLAAAYGSSSGQVALAILSRALGINLLPVAYKGTPQAVTDLLGGALPMAAIDVGSGVPHIAPGGRLTALAITGTGRSVSAPAVPTLSETFPNSDLVTWVGLVAPAGTPMPVVNKLNQAINSVLATAELKQSFASIAIEVEPVSPEDLGRRMQRDQLRWIELIRSIGIQPQ